MMVIKPLHQLVQRKDFFIILRAPSKKRHKINNRFREKTLFNQIFIGGMSAPLRQLLMIFVRNQRAMHIFRNLPAKSIIKAVIFRGGGKVFISTHNMGNPHQMIVYHIGKVVGGIAVRLNQDHVVQLSVIHRNVPVDIVMEGSRPFRRVILTYHIRFPCRKIRFYFLF